MIAEPKKGEYTPEQIREKLLKTIPASGKPMITGDLLYKRDTRKIEESDMWEEIRRMRDEGILDWDNGSLHVWRVRKKNGC